MFDKQVDRDSAYFLCCMTIMGEVLKKGVSPETLEKIKYLAGLRDKGMILITIK